MDSCLVVAGRTGTKMPFPLMRASLSLKVPRAAAVVPARHPLLDGVKDQVLLLDPVQERMRSGKHSAIGRDLELKNCRRPFGPQPQVCWTFVMCLRFLRALP